MNKTSVSKLRLKDNAIFIVTIAIAFAIIILGSIFVSELTELSSSLMTWVSEKFGWLYILSVFSFIIFLVWLSISKYGKIKLGKDNEKPEFTTFSWYSMLFCGSTGIGLVFWSIAEPLSHYALPPAGIDPLTQEAVDFSIRTCYLHWGLTQWACFALVGVAIAYFQFRKQMNCQISSLLSPLIGSKATNGLTGKIIDGFAIVVSFAGVATSLGLGVSQICGGMEYLFGIPKSTETILIIIVFISLIFIISSITGVYKGIRWLSNLNMYLAMALLIIAFCVGSQTTMLNNLTNSLGLHIQYLFKDLLMTNAFGDNTWVSNWRVFYFAWFIAWTPFVGMFVARISRGRTIREFIIGVVVIPSIFTIIWLAVFSTIALSAVNGWSVEAVSQLVASPETAVFIVMNKYPLAKLISILIVLLLAIFFITSADSATYSLAMMSSNANITPPTYKKVLWGIVVAAIAYILLAAGSLKPLQTISIAATLPFLLIMILIMPAMIKALKKEHPNPNH